MLASCGSVIVSFSRRTPKKVGYRFSFNYLIFVNFAKHYDTISGECQQVVDIVKRDLDGHSNIYIWDGEGNFNV